MIRTRGVLFSPHSLEVRFPGTCTATRGFTAPLTAGTGTLSVLATAAAAGAIGNGQATVAVADTVSPLIQLTVSPPDTAQLGEKITVNVSVSDNAALRY